VAHPSPGARGEIQDFTGVSEPYEPSETPELVVDIEDTGVEACVARIVEYTHRTFRAAP
jgi:adenylylsulfate kinase-like enzyme